MTFSSLFCNSLPSKSYAWKRSQVVPVQESKIMRRNFLLQVYVSTSAKWNIFVSSKIDFLNLIFASSISLLHFFVSWIRDTFETGILDYPVTRQHPSDLSISLTHLFSCWLNKFCTNYNLRICLYLKIHRFIPIGIIVKEIDPRRL